MNRELDPPIDRHARDLCRPPFGARRPARERTETEVVALATIDGVDHVVPIDREVDRLRVRRRRHSIPVSSTTRDVLGIRHDLASIVRKSLAKDVKHPVRLKNIGRPRGLTIDGVVTRAIPAPDQLHRIPRGQLRGLRTFRISGLDGVTRIRPTCAEREKGSHGQATKKRRRFIHKSPL